MRGQGKASFYINQIGNINPVDSADDVTGDAVGSFHAGFDDLVPVRLAASFGFGMIVGFRN